MRLRTLRLVLSLVYISQTAVPPVARAASLYFPGSIPEDIYANPKFRVLFLNGFSVSNSTAHKWLAEGLAGGEDEFLGREPTPLPPRKEISGQEGPTINVPDPNNNAELSQVENAKLAPALQMMRMGPKSSYLCLIPPPPPAPLAVPGDEKAPLARSPASSWELLQPMSTGCLYYTLGWFTYAYCHNKYVKQFREAAHSHPHPPGGRIPEEDPDWESYYLGVAPSPETADIVSSEALASANKLELARGAGQRYLVQKWDGGDLCDKTKQPRKIEVQFHCSMTNTDRISLIKETSVCQYVLVIHTPRLCGEPGFKSERDTQEETAMRCREILSEEDHIKHKAQIDEAAQVKKSAAIRNSPPGTPIPSVLPYIEQRHPYRFPISQPPPASVPHAAGDDSGAGAKKDGSPGPVIKKKKRDSAEIIRRAIKALLSGEDTEDINIEVTIPEGDDLAGSKAKAKAKPHVSGDSPIEDTDAEAGAGRKIKDDMFSVQGEDGKPVYFIVDGLEEVDDLEHFATLLGADGEPQAGNGGRLDAIRKKLLEAVTATGKAASVYTPTNSEDDGDDDSVPITHDEL